MCVIEAPPCIGLASKVICGQDHTAEYMCSVVDRRESDVPGANQVFSSASSLWAHSLNKLRRWNAIAAQQICLAASTHEIIIPSIHTCAQILSYPNGEMALEDARLDDAHIILDT